MENEVQKQQKASLWSIFVTFLKIGGFTIGGGYAMVLIIRDEITKKGWLPAEEFPDLIAISQAAPGVLAVNMSIFTGYRLRGPIGSVVATLGSISAPFLFILIIAMLFEGFKDNLVVASIFKGIRPVVVALIAVPMMNMMRTANKYWWTWAITLASLILVGFCKISPIYILVTVIFVSLAVAFGRYHNKGEGGK